jgi:predicted transcriptional regulator
MLKEKETYSIQELFDNLDISIRKLAEVAELSEVTLARIRDGKPTYRRTANHLLKVFSKLYDNRPFYLESVTGINVAVSGKKKAKEARAEEAA